MAELQAPKLPHCRLVNSKLPTTMPGKKWQHVKPSGSVNEYKCLSGTVLLQHSQPNTRQSCHQLSFMSQLQIVVIAAYPLYPGDHECPPK
jgi:hypothetical protein